MTQRFDSLGAAVDALLARIPGPIVLGLPLGIGKPNPFVNALYRRIKADPTRRLAIKHDGHARTVDVRIPAGVGDGSRVRIAGEGEMGSGGASSGDLYLRIRLSPHPTFERKGKDLYTTVHIPLTTAVLGGEAEVQTLSGKTLRLKVPATTQNGQTFRLKGHGMPSTSKPEPGDLYATVDVQLPRTITAAQRKHFEALAELDKGTTS